MYVMNKWDLIAIYSNDMYMCKLGRELDMRSKQHGTYVYLKKNM